MQIPDPNFFDGLLRISIGDSGFEDVPPWDHPLGRPNQEHSSGMRANYRGAGLADLVQAIKEGQEPRCSLERPLHAVEVMNGILQSAESGQSIEMKTRCTRPQPLFPDQAQEWLL